MLHPCQLANRWFVRTRELKWIMASKSCCSVCHNRNWMRWSNIDSLSSVFTFDTKLHTHKSIIAVNCISSIQQLSSHAQSMSFIVLLGLQFSIVTANFEITVVFLMTKINCACNMHRNNAELNSLFVFWANPLVVPLCVCTIHYAMLCTVGNMQSHAHCMDDSSHQVSLSCFELTGWRCIILYSLDSVQMHVKCCWVTVYSKYDNFKFEFLCSCQFEFWTRFWLQNLNYTSKNCIIFYLVFSRRNLFCNKIW